MSDRRGREQQREVTAQNKNQSKTKKAGRTKKRKTERTNEITKGRMERL